MTAAACRYCDDALNLSPLDTVKPVWDKQHVLTGLRVGQVFLPRPVVGMEMEHNIALSRPTRATQLADDLGVDALLAAASRAGGLPASGALWPKTGDRQDHGRLVLRGPGGMLWVVYDDCSKFELAMGEFTSARKAMAFKHALTPLLRRIISDAAADLAERFGRQPNLLVHLSGGDGTSSCASLHLNIPWSDRIAHAAYVSLEAYGPLQETLARQLALVNSVAATGMPAEDGMLADGRSPTYRQIVGYGTLEPCRAMQFNRLAARPSEGFDADGAGRNMQMVAAWGQSQSANFLMLALSQLEAIRLPMVVLGLYQPASLLADHANLLDLEGRLARDPRLAAQLHRRAHDDDLRFVAWLELQIGADVLAELVPDVAEALALDEQVLAAVERDDADFLVRTTDYAKKLRLTEAILARRRGGWRENLQAIRNVCFALCSPQELSPYHSHFEANDLQVLREPDLAAAGPDPLTRSYFLAQVGRFWDDRDIRQVSFDWNRLVWRRSRTLSGGWMPSVCLEDTTIRMPSPLGHNQPAVGRLFDRSIDSLQALFDVFGTRAAAVSTELSY